MEVYMGLIFLSAITFAPYGTLFCNGGPMAINNNAAMYSILGNTFGGTETTFNMPDLRGRVPVGSTTTMGNGVPAGLASYPYATTEGIENIQLKVENLAPHSHTAQVNATGLSFKLSPITATASGSLSVNATSGYTNVPGGSAGFPAQIPDLSSVGLSNQFYGKADGTNSMPVDVSVTVSAPTVGVTGGSVNAQIGNTGFGETFSVVQPWLALNYIITVMGIYPVRD